jgi:ABC-type lipoprotein release transport system permease subunit
MRRREIGILKAIGWETSDIILMKFWEGIGISLILLSGIILAYITSFSPLPPFSNLS